MSKKGQPGRRKKGNSHGNAPTRRGADGDAGDRRSSPIQSSGISHVFPVSSHRAPVARLTLPTGNELLVAERVVAAEQLAVAARLAPAESFPDESAPDLRPLDKDESGPRIVAHGVLAPISPPKATEIVHETEKVIVAAADREDAAEPNASLDEPSFPPMVQTLHGVAELDDRFFEEGDKAHEIEPARHAALVADLALEAETDAHAQKMTPAVRARRARFAKYVKAAVGFSAVLCVAALVRVAVARGQAGATGASMAAPEGVAAVVVAASPPAPDPVAPPAAVEAVPVLAAAAPVVDPAPPAAVVAEVAPSPTDAPPKTFAEEKKASRQALERGNAKVAIEAGERAVALDATDGDAWLVLGAAYQEKGNLVDARRCFMSCVKQGKKGTVSECAAMLR